MCSSEESQIVMISVDDSDHALNAFVYYVTHIHKQGNKVLILHVSEQVKIPVYGIFSGAQFVGPWTGEREGTGWSPDEVHVQVDAIRRKNRAIEDKYRAKCKECHIDHDVVVVTEDMHGTGAAIVDAAKKHKVDMIVMGSRGLGTVRRTLLGSVSTYVIHHSEIPALVCPIH